MSPCVTDLERPQDAVGDLHPEHVLGDRRPRAVRCGDRVQQHLRGLGGVGGVRLHRGDAVLGLELVDERLALADQLVGRNARVADVHALSGRSCRARTGQRRADEEAVRRDQLDTGVRSQHGNLVLDQLATVRADQAAQEDRIRVGRLDLLHQCLVVGGLRIPRVTPGHLDAELRRRLLEEVGHTDAVGLLVVEHVHALGAQLLRQGRVHRALRVVHRDHASVVSNAARVVLVGLTGLTAGLRQPEVGVGAADLDQSDPVQDRHLELGARRVERAQHADHAGIANVGIRVRAAGRRIVGTGLGRRVVTVLVLDRVLAGLVVVLGQHHVDGLRHLVGLDLVGTLPRQVGHDRVLAAALRCMAGGDVDRGARIPATTAA